MTCSPNAVRNHSDDVDLWIEVLKSHHHCGCTPSHGACIDDQHNRCAKDLCNFSSTSNVAGAALSIIEPHDSFNHGDISSGSSTKNIQHTAGWHHPGIQVIARSGCGRCQMRRINIVWSNFEWLDLHGSSSYMCNESCRHGCFAYSTGHTSENNSGNSQQHVNQ